MKDSIRDIFLWMAEQMRSNSALLESAFGNVKSHVKTAEAEAILIQGEARLRKSISNEEITAKHKQVPYYCPACGKDTYHSLDGCEICEDK